MDTKYQFDIDAQDVRQLAHENVERSVDVDLRAALHAVAEVAFSNHALLPTLGFSKKIDAGAIVHVPAESYIKKWINRYIAGVNSRPSVRKGKPSGTVPDSIVKQILGYVLADQDEFMINALEQGHSLIMTIENLVGDLLEEYLSVRLVQCGWYCCWGSTLQSVDFCKLQPSIEMLQIKTSDNSENSSSSKVRAGTAIKKWSRRISKKKDTYLWTDLVHITGCRDLDESSFRDFCQRVIADNPGCVFIDPAWSSTAE